METDCKYSFNEILDEMRDIHERKNHDYGNSFSESIDEWGYVSALVRIGDKVKRLKQLLVRGEGAQVKDESAIDTAIDLANYAVMLASELRRRREERELDMYGVTSTTEEIPQYEIGI